MAMSREQHLAMLGGYAARLLALPPGNWGETVQAYEDLSSALLIWGAFDPISGRCAREFSLPSGARTADEQAAVDAWLTRARSQGHPVHPDRVTRG